MSENRKFTTKQLVIIAMLVALNVILSRFLMWASLPQQHGTNTSASVSRLAASLLPSKANLTSSIADTSPLFCHCPCNPPECFRPCLWVPFFSALKSPVIPVRVLATTVYIWLVIQNNLGRHKRREAF